MASKRLESAAHIAMGFGAELLNLGLLLERRERRQLPPENDEYPVVWVDPGSHATRAYRGSITPPAKHMHEYWSKARIMDTLDDSREYLIGQTVAWFAVVGAAFAAGWACS